jgi:hypothetical protein
MAADFKQGTNLVGGTLACSQVAAASITTVYTVPALSAAKIATFVIHNASASTLATVAVNKTPSGGASTRVALISNLAAGDSTSVDELVGAFLEAGCVIAITPSAVTAANYDITGAVSS